MKRLAVAGVLVLVMAGVLAAHDMFLRPDSFFVAPGGTISVRVLNGTFSKSENAVTRDRVRDLSLVTPDGVTHPDTSEWDDRGDTTTSSLRIRASASGTYVIGASIRPRELRLEAKEFNAYLASDGLPDVLEARRRDDQLGAAARERYSKHVKAVVQVGDRRTDEFDTALGYPAELIPLENPYSVRVGGTLRLRAVVDGEPVANQLVVAGGRTPSGARLAPQSVRTDSAGIATIRLSSRGAWYVKFIHMERAVADTSIDYESKGATVTFGVR
jgi:uncharacterized GH25 family protein